MSWITITFAKNQKTIKIPMGSNLMKELLNHNIPVASSCGGDGVCGKCYIQILEGQENISVPTEHEIFLKQKYNLSQNQRVSCQCYVYGDITIDTKYW